MDIKSLNSRRSVAVVKMLLFNPFPVIPVSGTYRIFWSSPCSGLRAINSRHNYEMMVFISLLPANHWPLSCSQDQEVHSWAGQRVSIYRWMAAAAKFLENWLTLSLTSPVDHIGYECLQQPNSGLVTGGFPYLSLRASKYLADFVVFSYITI